jgi:hypothetical protein
LYKKSKVGGCHPPVTLTVPEALMPVNTFTAFHDGCEEKLFKLIWEKFEQYLKA